ncbi:MAG: FAD-dependent oxidoreductase [Actinomycetota bacterium]|jgi:hypothetical protein
MNPADATFLRQLAHAQPEVWWLDSDPLETDPFPALVGEVTADLCVVGGGYTGLWTALLAKERHPQRRVVIVEQLETGAGASGRNGGFCSASLTHGFRNGRRRFPTEIAALERMGRENLDAIEATITKYNIECDWERSGELRVATEEWQMRELLEEAELRNQMGDEVEILSAEQVRERVNSPTYVGGLFDPDGTALIDPARLVWGLERACRSLGVEIFEHSRVESLVDAGDVMHVHTAYGRIVAKRVALATNVFPSLVRRARKYVLPVYDYQLATEPLTPEQRTAINWAGREGLSDSGNQFHYYRLTTDGAILWGGFDAIYNFRGKVRQEYEANPEVYARLAEHFNQTFPQLSDVKFTHSWAGVIDTCTRFSAFWGMAHRKKVAYVLGFTGLGVAATRFGALTMLDLLDGHTTERTQLKMVRRRPLPFPPEPFRWIIFTLTHWSLVRADAHQGRRNLWLRLTDALGLGFDS